MGLRAPRAVVTAKRQRYQRRGKPIHRAELLHESDYTIMATYQLEYRGIVNYYRHAYNLHRVPCAQTGHGRLATKTLAAKHHTSVGSIYRKYRTQVEVDGENHQGLQVTIAREGKKPLVATWGGIPLKWDIKASLDDQPPPIWHDRSELEQRLLAQVCEHCGATHRTDHLEVHHIRALKDLNKYEGQEKPVPGRRSWRPVIARRWFFAAPAIWMSTLGVH